MNHKSLLFALILLLMSASGAAARPPSQPAAISTAVSTAAVAPPYAQGGCFVAGMNGGNETTTAQRQNETQQVVTPATGVGAFVLAPSDPLTTTRKLTYSIIYTGTLGPETMAHIHKGAPGVAGPPIITLPVGNPKQGTLSLDAQTAADLLAGLLYVNIHTAPNPNGEIRGQILPGGGCFSATLNGRNETPPNTSAGTGSGIFLLMPSVPFTITQHLLFTIGYTRTSSLAVGANIRKGAPGVSGPVVSPLPFSNNPITGTVALSSQNVTDLAAGLLYVNISTGLVQLGEIRGQILPFGGVCYSATLAGSTETPPNASTATGRGTFFLSPSTLTTTLKLAYAINYSTTLTPTMAHIHKGAQGIAGGIVFPLSTNNPITGTITLNQQQATDLMSGLYYVNIHSATFTQGEIRGQIVQSTCKTVFLPAELR